MCSRPIRPLLGFTCASLLLLAGLLAWGTPPAPTAMALSQVPAVPPPIIIDHTTTDLSKIPPTWIEAAKQLALHYGHTSHGSQLITGAEWLMTQDTRYAVDIQYGLPLAGTPGDLRVYDGNNYDGDNYIVPEMYWSTQDGLDHTRSVINSGDFNVSMWAWCGQQSTNDDATVDQYLGALQQLGGEFPATRFVYFTGHTDGGSDSLARNNQRVRSFVQANGGVLYDFADIESYDPDGNYYPGTDDSCPWCSQWCAAHPDDCAGLPLEQTDWCAHSHAFNCKLKAGAFWWMMARLAGWDGQSGNPTATPTATPTEPGTMPTITPAAFLYLPASSRLEP